MEPWALATMLVRSSRRRTADGSYGSWIRELVVAMTGELLAVMLALRERRRSTVIRCVNSMSTWTGAASASPFISLQKDRGVSKTHGERGKGGTHKI